MSEQTGPVVDPADLLHVIVNPASGNGRARKRWPEISRTLLDRGLHHEVFFTSGPGDAISIARELAGGGARTIVAVGGDGTVNEILNGMLNPDGSTVNGDTRLLVLPSGTGRDLGRTLGTGKVETAIEALERDTTARIDLGRITYRTPQGDEAIRFFANVADFGLGASVAHRINHSSKALGGLVTYLIAAVRTIIHFKPVPVQVRVQGDLIYDDAANMVVLANGRYFAGGMLVAPTASICDGLLEVYIVADVGRRTLLTSLLPRVYRGKHVGRKGILHVRASEIAIDSPQSILVEMDGEQVGTSPITVDVVRRAVPVIISRASRAAMAGYEP